MALFTTTPYEGQTSANGTSFYGFYADHAGQPGRITKDLWKLDTKVSNAYLWNDGWGWDYPSYLFVNSPAGTSCGLRWGVNVHAVTDIQIDEGRLFSANGSRLYDVVIMGHEEYVTASEYSQLQRFVSGGGRIVTVGADDMNVLVTYDPKTGVESYVKGHGFARNTSGVYWEGSWAVTSRPFEANNTLFFGSSLCCPHGKYVYSGAMVNGSDPIGRALARKFGPHVFQQYSSHEESAIRNWTDTSVIATFVSEIPEGCAGGTVAAYAHRFHRGSVVSLSIFGLDSICSDRSMQYFLAMGVAGYV
jgi:hypothetical protein